MHVQGLGIPLIVWARLDVYGGCGWTYSWASTMPCSEIENTHSDSGRDGES